MNRRGFFRALAATALMATASTTGLAQVSAALTRAVPILYGDGKHDDTEALQALFDRKPVARADGAIVESTNTLPEGHYRFYRPVILSDGARINNCQFTAEGADVFLDARKARGFHITNSDFRRTGVKFARLSVGA